MKYEDFLVTSLGKGGVVSPLKQNQRVDSPIFKFVNDAERILFDVSLENFNHCKETGETPISFEKAGPRENIFFEPANANDSKFCNLLAQNAVLGALSGKTNFVLGFWNNQVTLMPIPIVVAKRKKIDIESELWWNVLESTGHPISMKIS